METMKELHELQFPDNLRYYEEHEWCLREGANVKIGISDYAQDRLGDVVFVELPEPGAVFKKGDIFGTVESVKSVSELYMPLSGTVFSVNASLEENPEFVNDSPYSDGWMVVLKSEEDPGDTENPNGMGGLMDAGRYLNMLKGLE